MQEVWYRYADTVCSELGWDGEPSGSYRVEVYLHEFPVLKHTAKGVWLDASYGFGTGRRRFVRHAALRRWACPTPAEARAAFIARKRAQVRILKGKLEIAEVALRKGERLADLEPPSPS